MYYKSRINENAKNKISDFWNYEESSTAQDLIEKLNEFTKSNFNGAKNEIKHLIDEIVDAVEHVVSSELF
ncbi:hypothetical protein DAPK24_016230 [Pichia kluyveri]|uniref:Uncharacterized protein n=1 Tax=Pichia kluyveri TaxID=36015 RepID=A0AAV5R0H1_PICKL|nr:hypothetical protein DAPK24_016230 [Pichia kluyveri]